MLRLTLFLAILIVGFSCKKKEFPIPSDEIRCSPEKEVLVTSMEYNIDSIGGRKNVISYQYNLKKLEMIQEKMVEFKFKKLPEEKIINTFKIEYPSENKIKIIKNDNDYCNFEINNDGNVDKINYTSGDTLYLYYNSLGQVALMEFNYIRHYLEYSSENHLVRDSIISFNNNKWEWYQTFHYYQDKYAPNPLYRDKWIHSIINGMPYIYNLNFFEPYIPNGYWINYPKYELATEDTGIMRFFVLYQNGMIKYWSESMGLPGLWYIRFKYGCF